VAFVISTPGRRSAIRPSQGRNRLTSRERFSPAGLPGYSQPAWRSPPCGNAEPAAPSSVTLWPTGFVIWSTMTKIDHYSYYF
ncbi:hypothetical protein ACFXJ8_43915, partial [Nonomuraea sp. NPDC059194]|uniref:hypothetical protein n=1 Tax=Nonomuraea sp. NPDC059194 TaxID=3346764 RepID=UPI0036B58403